MEINNDNNNNNYNNHYIIINISVHYSKTVLLCNLKCFRCTQAYLYVHICYF